MNDRKASVHDTGRPGLERWEVRTDWGIIGRYATRAAARIHAAGVNHCRHRTPTDAGTARGARCPYCR